MGQRPSPGSSASLAFARSFYSRFYPLAALCLILITTFGCDRSAPSPPPSASTQPARLTVASLVPAATDLLIDMGAGDHLVAVSNYDSPGGATAALPRVGDYETTDWEKLAALKPSVMIVQIAPDRISQGMKEHAAALGMRLISVHLETIGDIDATYAQLGQAVGQPGRAAVAVQRLHARLDAVRRRVLNQPPVRTLLALDETASFVGGPGTFLDEALTIAGGQNVLGEGQKPYLSIDPERLAALAPDAVIQILPGASPQVRQRAEDFWKHTSGIPAVVHGRITPITDPYAMTPSSHVADLAEAIAAALHPQPTTEAGARP